MQSTDRSPVRFGRKYGPTFNGFDNMANVSLCSHDLGPVHIDCRLKHSKTQLGVFGPAKNRAGILYMDLKFVHPTGCRLTNAVVWVSLEENAAPDRRKSQPKRCDLGSEFQRKTRTANSGSSDLRIVESRPKASRLLHFAHDCYGPRQLEGQPTEVVAKQSHRFTPEVNILGNGGGGVGYSRDNEIKYTSCWMFTGNLLTGSRLATKTYDRNGTHDMAYRILRWELSEDDFQPQSKHSNEIQTAFTIEHDHDPFFIRIEIEGHLRRGSDRLKNKFLMFPSESKKKDGSSEILVLPDKEVEPKRRLDPIGQGLPYQMEQRNLENLRVQIPNSLPVSFKDLSEPVADNAAGPKIELDMDDEITLHQATSFTPHHEFPKPLPKPRPAQHISSEPTTQFEASIITTEKASENLERAPAFESTSASPVQVDQASTPVTEHEWSKEEPKTTVPRPKIILIEPKYEGLDGAEADELEEITMQLFHRPLLLFALRWVIYLISFLPVKAHVDQREKM